MLVLVVVVMLELVLVVVFKGRMVLLMLEDVLLLTEIEDEGR